MTGWVIRRWTQYGHDRLYAETSGGTALGYLDLKTQRFHSDDLSNLPLLQRAIADHLAREHAEAAVADQAQAPAQPNHAAAPNPEPAAATSHPSWVDISDTRPGAAARERALAAQQGAPVRTMLARLLGVKTDERSWRIGADGEEAVAAQLAKLGSVWNVLHAVRVGDRGSDIDHVVIGPGGVFTVNTKNHPQANVWVAGDTFMVNGRAVQYIRNSRHEARRAAKVLTERTGFPVSVTGLIAVMGARRGFTVKEQPRDGAVVVVRRRQISQYLLGRPTTMSDREIATVYEVARRSTTWQT